MAGDDEKVRFEVGERVPAPGNLEGELKKVRGFYVLPHILKEFWYTQRCAQCSVKFVINCSKSNVFVMFINKKTPNAVDSDSIEPLSVLHSKLKL